MKFKVTQHIKDCIKIEDEYRHIEAAIPYSCETFDDLKELLLTIIDYSDKPIAFEIEKEEG